MKIKDLKEFLKTHNIPDDAEIIISCDFGDNEELARNSYVSRSDTTLGTESMIFEFPGYEEVYDDEALNAYKKKDPVTALLISSIW